MGFPLERTNDRALPPDYHGPVDVFDIDKTYLESDFESVKDLALTALDRAVDRRPRPGVAPLLRALRRGPHPEDPHHARAPLYFVSASPPQLRKVLEGRMLMDGVEFDGISCKDHLALIRAGRFKEVRRHVAYKLTALLEYRREWPAGAREWLYGDDAETDALIYDTYAQIREGTLLGAKLDMALAKERVAAADRRYLKELAAECPRGAVEAIFIFRVAKAPRIEAGRFPRVTVVQDAAECARMLADRGRIAADAVEVIEKEIAADQGG